MQLIVDLRYTTIYTKSVYTTTYTKSVYRLYTAWTVLHTENVAGGQTESFQNVGGGGGQRCIQCINLSKV